MPPRRKKIPGPANPNAAKNAAWREAVVRRNDNYWKTQQANKKEENRGEQR